VFCVETSQENLMQHSSRVLRVVAALAFAISSGGALAQTVQKFVCQGIGAPAAREPVGDRDGHYISVSNSSCHSASGSTMTVTTIWEFDNGKGMILSGNSVTRQTGGMAVAQSIEGTQTILMTDGKPTGFTGNAKGVYKAAKGSMATLAGKPYTSSFQSIDGGQFSYEISVP
jgi:hypothetical protein